MEVLNEIMIRDEDVKKIHDEVLIKSQEKLKTLRDKVIGEFTTLSDTFNAMIEKNKKVVNYNIKFDKFHPDNVIEFVTLRGNVIEAVTLRGKCKVYKDASNEEIKSEILNTHNFKIEIV